MKYGGLEIKGSEANFVFSAQTDRSSMNLQSVALTAIQAVR